MPFAWNARCLQAYAANPPVLDAAFKLADSDKDGVVNGDDAVRFFTQSGLPDAALSRVWKQSSQNQPYLDLDRFKSALLLCAREMDSASLANAPAPPVPNGNPFLDASPPPSPQPSPAAAEANPYLYSRAGSGSQNVHHAGMSAVAANHFASSSPTRPACDAPAERASFSTSDSFRTSSFAKDNPFLDASSESPMATQYSQAPGQDGANGASWQERCRDDESASPKTVHLAGTSSASGGAEERDAAARQQDSAHTKHAPGASSAVVEPTPSVRGPSEKKGIMGSIVCAIGTYRERAAERKMQGKIKQHCGDRSPVDVIAESLQRLNHLWLAGYKYEHEKTSKQLALELLDNKHITLDHILSISDILKENARSVGGSGDDVLSKGINKIRRGIGNGVNSHPDRDKLIKAMQWSFISLVQNQTTYPLVHSLKEVVSYFMAENKSNVEKAARSLYMFASKLQLKAQAAEEKRVKALKHAEAKLDAEKQKQLKEEALKSKIDVDNSTTSKPQFGTGAW